MSIVKPRTPAGVMELTPLDQIAFQRMLDTIRRNYERFGFVPVETPVMEWSEILLTKSGGETERQVFFVQSSGSIKQGDQPELALRFDLTVPLARYVAEHEHALAFPFRRYQIQRVYRGESAQRGRFREFYQCDIDVIGKDQLSIRFDAEIPAVIYHVFKELAVGKFTVHINNRKLMRGFFQHLGVVDVELQGLILREVDKLDKRGAKHVYDTLVSDAFKLDQKVVQEVLSFVQYRSHNHADALARIAALGAGNQSLDEGVRELTEVLEMIRGFGVPEEFYCLNFSIARGLDYYTGTVYETVLDDHLEIGSVCSGGRYENLAGHYSKSHLPGVGISIGATRLFYQLQHAGLVGRETSATQVLVLNLDQPSFSLYQDIASELRNAGINTELVMETSKLAKQFKYADKSGIQFAVVLGSNEIANETVAIKNLMSQTQAEIKRCDLVNYLRTQISVGVAP